MHEEQRSHNIEGWVCSRTRSHPRATPARTADSPPARATERTPMSSDSQRASVFAWSEPLRDV